MKIIYKKIIENYVPKLTINDLKEFNYKKNIEYKEDELIIIYQFIKYHYHDLLDKNIKEFEEIKEKINPNLYKKLLHLYIDYKQKYL